MINASPDCPIPTCCCDTPCHCSARTVSFLCSFSHITRGQPERGSPPPAPLYRVSCAHSTPFPSPSRVVGPDGPPALLPDGRLAGDAQARGPPSHISLPHGGRGESGDAGPLPSGGHPPALPERRWDGPAGGGGVLPVRQPDDQEHDRRTRWHSTRSRRARNEITPRCQCVYLMVFVVSLFDPRGLPPSWPHVPSMSEAPLCSHSNIKSTVAFVTGAPCARPGAPNQPPSTGGRIQPPPT